MEGTRKSPRKRKFEENLEMPVGVSWIGLLCGEDKGEGLYVRHNHIHYLRVYKLSKDKLSESVKMLFDDDRPACKDLKKG